MKPRNRTRIGPRGSRSGITILGVLLCLCAVGLIAIFAIPAFFERPNVTLDNVARVLARDLRSAQNAAAYTKVACHVEFDEDGWRVVDERGVRVRAIGEDHPIERSFSHDAVFEGVAIEEVAFGADRTLAVDRRGVVGEAGAIVLAFRGERLRLELDPRSGQFVAVESR